MNGAARPSIHDLMSTFLLIAIAVLLLTLLFGVYVFRRARRTFRLGRWPSLVLGAAILLGPVALVVGRMRVLGPDFEVGTALIGAALTLGTIFAAVLLFHVDIARGLAALAARFWPDRGDARDERAIPAAAGSARTWRA